MPAAPVATAAFDWAWLSIFAACVVITVTLSAIILLVVWLTGGFKGRG